MRRLLIVGTEVPNFPCISWREWPSASPLDYQGLVLDCRKPLDLPNQLSIAQTLSILVKNNHIAYIILPGAKDLPSLTGAMAVVPSYSLFLEAASGQSLNVRPDDKFLEAYAGALSGHEIFFRLQLPHNTRGLPVLEGIVDNVSRTICARVGTIYVLHPPAKKHEQNAFKIIVEYFRPDPLPFSSIPKPSWVEEVASALPGVTELQAVRASIAEEMRQKSEHLKLEEEKLRALTSWADLLWLEGLPLQNKVNEALALLGISCHSGDPTAHACDLSASESGLSFVFEVTGSSGTIGIEKGRQLMQWVLESQDPAGTKGVLVANAFRTDPPTNRPPTQDKRIFVLELERLGIKYHLALLDVRELYRVVSLKLSGQPIDKSLVIQGLTTDGVVRFPI
jgi:hypothetical protein